MHFHDHWRNVLFNWFSGTDRDRPVFTETIALLKLVLRRISVALLPNGWSLISASAWRASSLKWQPSQCERQTPANAERVAVWCLHSILIRFECEAAFGGAWQ